MSPEQAREFLDSLDGENGLPQDYRLLTPGVDTYKYGDEWLHGDFTWCAVSSASIGKLVDKNFNPIVRRAESLQIPDLKERVKAFGLACMDAAQRNEFALDKETVENYESFRALCAPEVKP